MSTLMSALQVSQTGSKVSFDISFTHKNECLVCTNIKISACVLDVFPRTLKIKKLILTEIVDEKLTLNNCLGISLQAMDTSHVALVSLNLSSEGFEEYRCDQPVVLGINIANISKVLKLADAQDSITLQADQDPSTLKITFENQKSGRTTEFALNLITLDVEHLSIPDTEYTSIITINSSEFSKICKELQQLSDGLTIQTKQDEVYLQVEGPAGSGQIKLSSNESDRKED